MKEKSTNPVIEFFVSAFDEFKKVTWPTRDQAILLTAVVLGISGVMAVVIGVFDLGLSETYQSLLKYINSLKSNG